MMSDPWKELFVNTSSREQSLELPLEETRDPWRIEKGPKRQRNEEKHTLHELVFWVRQLYHHRIEPNVT
jgi:hypothetical protein